MAINISSLTGFEKTIFYQYGQRLIREVFKCLHRPLPNKPSGNSFSKRYL